MADQPTDPIQEPHVQEESGSLDSIQHVNNPVLDLPTIEKKYLAKVIAHSKEGNAFYFSDGSAKVEIKVISDEIIRVRLAPHGSFLEEFSYAVPNPNQYSALFDLEETADAFWSRPIRSYADFKSRFSGVF